MNNSQNHIVFRHDNYKKNHKACNYRLRNAISIVKKNQNFMKKAQKVDFIFFWTHFEALH